jgi:hypothetical protein
MNAITEIRPKRRAAVQPVSDAHPRADGSAISASADGVDRYNPGAQRTCVDPKPSVPRRGRPSHTKTDTQALRGGAQTSGLVAGAEGLVEDASQNRSALGEYKPEQPGVSVSAEVPTEIRPKRRAAGHADSGTQSSGAGSSLPALAGDVGPTSGDTQADTANVETSPRRRGRRGQGNRDTHMRCAATQHSSCQEDGGGHFDFNIHEGRATPKSSGRRAGRDAHYKSDTQQLGGVTQTSGSDAGSEGQCSPGIQVQDALSPILARIVTLWREQRILQATKGDMQRRIKADQRWFAAARVRAAGGVIGSKFPPVLPEDKLAVELHRQSYFRILAAADDEHARIHREMCDLAKMWVPKVVLDLAEGIAGVGISSVCGIIGESNDPRGYATVSRLWKRMGLNVTGAGEAPRRVAGQQTEGGYNPRRRSVMRVIGDCIIKAQVRSDKDDDGRRVGSHAIGPLGEFYLAHRAREERRNPEMSAKRQHNRALRRVEKEVLRMFWRAWHGHETEGCWRLVVAEDGTDV